MINLDFIKSFLIDLLGVGAGRLDELIAEGDKRVLERPELDPEWQQVRAALVAAKDDPTIQEKLEAAVSEGIATFVNRHGEVGPSHGMAGG
jgi:hypothetical protein